MSTDHLPLRLNAHPMAGSVGAWIDTLDLNDGLDAEMVDDLHWLLAERGVVVFTNQRLDVAGHLAFARQLGGVRTPPDYVPTLRAEGFGEVGVLRSEPGLGNGADTWHADVTWSPKPPRYSVAHMQSVPAAGGDTMWASLIQAYGRLSPAMQQFVMPLTAEHSVGAAVARRAYGGKQYGQGTKRPPEAPSLHPVVHRHPVSGDVALSVNPTFTGRIAELTGRESAGVLEVLFDAILSPECICRWSWSAGDVAIWDNHFVLHYAIHDYDGDRVLHRIEIDGEALIPASRSVERELVS